MNRIIKATWQNGGFEKNYDYPVHTIPKHHEPYQNGWSPKGFFSSEHPCGKMVSAAFKYVPQITTTTFAFSSVSILVLCPLRISFEWVMVFYGRDAIMTSNRFNIVLKS